MSDAMPDPRGEVITVRVTREERALYARAADEIGVSVSDVVRMCCRAQLAAGGIKALKRGERGERGGPRSKQ